MTHVPFDENLSDEKKLYYAHSLDLLRKLHTFYPESKIVAFTGAFEQDLPDESLLNQGVHKIIRRCAHDYNYHENLYQLYKEIQGEKNETT
jgi:hypothetical protein